MDPTTEILVANHERFLRFLTGRLRSRDDAEEVLQAAFVKGLSKKDSIRDGESAIAWFFRLLRNAATDHHRRRGAEKRRVDRRAKELKAETDDEPLQQVVCACVADLVPLLKPEYATVLRRAELEGASMQEVAQELDITPNNAAVRLHRARAALKKKLEEACGTCTEHGCLDCSCREE